LELPEEKLGSQRTMLLNGIPVSAQQMRDAAGGTGKVRFEPDPAMQKIMDAVPHAVSSERALALGFRHSANIEEIVDEYKKNHSDPALARNG
jgi:D-erythronate 2-dehydrogenase